jgi:hypothetical protein
MKNMQLRKNLGRISCTMKTPIFGNEPQSTLNRRSFLRRAGAAAAMVPFAGMALGASRAFGDGNSGMDTDVEILNFALNLEYLEAEYYSYATTGAGLAAQGVELGGLGKKGTVTVRPNAMVPFSDPLIQQYALEIARDEKRHVLFLREALGNDVVAEPSLNLYQSFNTIAQAAGTASDFDPFANDLNFLLGAFIFEDVGVTAYHGAAPLITDKGYLAAAAGILGTEAYHASSIRTLLSRMNYKNPNAIANAVQKISDLRNELDGKSDDDQGIILEGTANLVPTNPNSLVFARAPHEVLNIVYGAVGASKGLFFPDGVNETPYKF